MRICIYCVVTALLFVAIPGIATTADRVVINQVMVSGSSGQSTNEFIELYNPTGSDVVLDGWSMVKRTSSGTAYVLVDSFTGMIIPPGHYFLITHPTGYLGTAEPDITYSSGNSMADNNSVELIDADGGIVDLVGFGSATHAESAPAANPGSNKSIVRTDGIDTDNNAADFSTLDVPQPHNTSYVPVADATADDEPIAYATTVCISEFLPGPVGTDDTEFIELFNRGTVAVDLTGWKIGDNSSRRYAISNQTIAALSYLVLPKSLTGIALNNTADSVRLYWPDNTEVESVAYTGSHEGQSYSLIGDVWQWTDAMTPGAVNRHIISNTPPEAVIQASATEVKVSHDITFDGGESNDSDADELIYAWDFGDGQTSAEKKPTHAYTRAGAFRVSLTVTDEHGATHMTRTDIIVSDYDYSDAIIISEVLPSCMPSDSVCEFIELHNSGDRDVSLDGWQLTDGSRYFTFGDDSTVPAGAFLVVERVESKITLNNSGEQLYLVDPTGTIIHGVTIPKAPKDYAFAFADGRWEWTEVLTPGAENEIVPPAEDAEGMGTDVSTASLELRQVGIGEVTDEMIGQLLQVSGTVDRANSRGIYLMDEDGNVLRVYIQAKTGIVQPELNPGDLVTVTGVLDKTSAGLRLLPRTQDDISIPSSIAVSTGDVLGASTDQPSVVVPAPAGQRAVMYYLIGAAVAIGAGIAAYVIRERQQRRRSD